MYHNKNDEQYNILILDAKKNKIKCSSYDMRCVFNF